MILLYIINVYIRQNYYYNTSTILYCYHICTITTVSMNTAYFYYNYCFSICAY